MFLVIEAKAKVGDIIDENNMKKFLETFKKECDKINEIAGKYIENFSDFEIICGFVFHSSLDNIDDELSEIENSFNNKKSEIEDLNCEEHVEFIVIKTDNGLEVLWNSESNTLKEKLSKFLPSEIAPYK